MRDMKYGLFEHNPSDKSPCKALGKTGQLFNSCHFAWENSLPRGVSQKELVDHSKPGMSQ